MSEHTKGVVAAAVAYVFWGPTPIYWNAIEGVAALELLGHRVVWSLPILAALISVRRRWGTFRSTYRARITWIVELSMGVLISVNWLVFIWAVTSEHIVDASLGYFINPLVSVALGVVVLREHLRPAAKVAVGLAFVGVTTMTLMLGVLPWISLVLAFSFGFYGLLKKHPAAAPPLEGLLVETATIAVPLGAFLAVRAADGAPVFGSTPGATVLLLFAGAVTVVPLALFGAGAQRIPLSTVGLLQYLAPTLQLLVGVTLYGEILSGAELLGFLFVWAGLAIYTTDNIRRARRMAATPSTAA